MGLWDDFMSAIGKNQNPGPDTTGEDRVNQLGAAGFQWVSGNGVDNALWRAPNGSVMTENAALNALQTGSVPLPPKDSTAGLGFGNAPEIIYDAQGHAFTFSNGQQQALPQFDNPTKAAGYSGGASAGTQLGYAQLAQSQQQFEARQAADMAQFNAKYAADMQRNQQDQALAYATLDFNKQKEAFAQTQDNRRLELQATQYQQDSQFKIANLQTQQVQMQASRDQFNAQMALETQKANQAFQAQARADLAQAGRDIAEYASHPTDYGKLAAYLTANQRFGGPATQITGKDFTSDTSLAPLGAGLKAAQDAQARTTQSPYQFTPLAAPNQPGASIPGYNPNDVARNQNRAMGLPDELPNPNYNNPYAQINAIAQQQGASGTNFAGFNPKGEATPGGHPYDTPVQAMKEGGMAQGAYVSGEKGPELNIPIGKGKALVFNEDQMEAMGLNLKRIVKMAQGGVFDSGTAITGGAPDTTDPRQFLDESLQRAMAPLPTSWNVNGRDSLPSAVFASSPGTSPIVTQFLGGLSAMAGLLPADEYARQAALIAPTGVRETNIRRTG